MSQIITLSVGGSAVNVGISFFQHMQKIRTQSQKQNQLSYFSRFFTESQDGEVLPKTIYADSDINSNIKASSSLNLDQNNVIGYGNSCLNIYAEGKYQEGAEISTMIQQRVRHQVQKCDLLSGFILLRSPLGGAGSGIGENALSLISQSHHSKVIEEFKLMPGFDSFNHYKNLTPLQVYNTVLTDNSSVVYSNLVYTIQNKAVQKILSDRKQNNRGDRGYENINDFYGDCIRQHVNPYIYGGHLNTNQRKRATNLIPYPRVNHLECSISNPKQQNHLFSALSYTNRLNQSSQSYDGNILALNINVKGENMTEHQVINAYNKWSNSTGNRYIDWVQNTIHVSITKEKKQNNKSWVLINGRKNVEWLKRIQDQFPPIFRRKAFLWHYTSRGMDEMQFVQAQSSMNDHVSQYIVYDTYVDPDDYQ